jgi:carboxypeptidase PM20D1
MKKFFIGLFIVTDLLLFVIIFRTFMFSSKQPEIEPIAVFPVSDSAKYHLSEAISIPTISNEDPILFDSTSFDLFMRFMETTYPLVHSKLAVTPINTYSRIFYWEGTDPSLNPIILMGHLDVVPVAEENRSKWKEEPFGQTIKEGVIWGRGAIDDKISVIGNLEAVESLLAENYQPQRSIYLCFGHDEELGGVRGATSIVNYLEEQGVEAEFVMDEGFAVTQGLTPGVSQDVAMIGTAEKGFVSLTLKVNMEGGHSSMPKPESAIDMVSKAVIKLKENPFPAIITQPVEDFMMTTGPEMGFVQKMAFANLWLFKPLVIKTLEEFPSSNAMIRTTTAPTIIQGGVKENVIPYEAQATINFRLLPGTTIEDVKARVRDLIADDRITIEEGPFNSESPGSSPTDGFGYQMIRQTVHELFPNTLTTPNLVIGGTDSRYYYPISPNVYRFTPFYLNAETLKTFHGINERISVEDFETAVRYYTQLIRNSTGS